tara:strand:- start:247 stop:696 length:450 start_codon:yes stop_codon:yes gene_type:complete
MAGKNNSDLKATIALKSTKLEQGEGSLVFPGVDIDFSLERTFSIDGDHISWVNMDVDNTAANNILTQRVAATVDAESRQLFFGYNAGDTDVVIGMYDNSETTNHPILYLKPGEWAFCPFKFGQATDYLSASVASGTGSIQYAIFELGVS